MKESIKRFLIKSLAIFVFLVIASWALFSFVLENYDFPGRIAGIAIVWAVTFGFHCWLLKVVSKNPRAFNRVYMMQTGIKLLIYIGCVMIYLSLHREFAIRFVAFFMAVYIVFAVFEVISILGFIKHKAGTSGRKK
jgi:hypothetical protein